MKKFFIISFLFFIFGLIFVGLFRINLTGMAVESISKGEAAHQGFISEIYLYLGISFQL